MKAPIRRTRPEKTGVHAPLGDLEQAVMRCVWRSDNTGILGGDVQEQVSVNHPVALTTILTTLDRLYDKEIVRRERESKAYRYWAAVTEEKLQQRIVGGVLDRLIAQFPQAVASYFSQQNKDAENETLHDLARKLEQTSNPEKQEDDHGH